MKLVIPPCAGCRKCTEAVRNLAVGSVLRCADCGNEWGVAVRGTNKASGFDALAEHFKDVEYKRFDFPGRPVI